MTDVRFEGLLHKPGRIPGRKTKVWCVLDGKELFFYRENKRSSCIGSLDLTLVRKVEKVVSTGSEFLIDYDGRFALYAAENSVKCDEWITYIKQAIQPPDKSDEKPIAEQAHTKETHRYEKADDKTTSIKSRTETLKPSAEYKPGGQKVVNEVSIVQKEVQSKPTVSDKPHRRPSYKKEEINRSNLTANSRHVNSKREVETVEKNVPVRDLNFTKPDSSWEAGGKESADQTQKNSVKTGSYKEKLAKDVLHSNLSGKETETKCDSGRPETYNSKPENIYTSQTDIKPNLGNSTSFSSFPHTQEENRPDSGYETLVGSESRKSVATEDYGEVDISCVVMRKSRRSIPSITMNNSEVEIPKMESGPSSNGPKETSYQISDKDSPCERTTEEKCIQKEESVLLRNGDIHKDQNSEVDEVYKNVNNTVKDEKKEKDNSEETANDYDYVPMRRNIVSKRSTMVDVHVPQVVLEADEDDDNDDYTQPSSEGGLLTEEQEDLLMNLTFEPIEELPFKLDDVQNNRLDFFEIQGLVKGSKIQVRNSVSSDENPVESLRKLLDKL